MTLVLNLYGGPGTGKSTTAARVFAELKMRGIEAELVTEFAKDLTWEERSGALSCQAYVIGKQIYRVHRLLHKVDVVVTDAPILLGLVYSQHEPPSFQQYIVDVHNSWNTLDVFLKRHPDKVYSASGRNQTSEEARNLDERIHDALFQWGILHHVLPGPPHDVVPWIYDLVLDARAGT